MNAKRLYPIRDQKVLSFLIGMVSDNQRKRESENREAVTILDKMA